MGGLQDNRLQDQARKLHFHPCYIEANVQVKKAAQLVHLYVVAYVVCTVCVFVIVQLTLESEMLTVTLIRDSEPLITLGTGVIFTVYVHIMDKCWCYAAAQRRLCCYMKESLQHLVTSSTGSEIFCWKKTIQ